MIDFSYILLWIENNLSSEIIYAFLIVLLFIVPRLFLRVGVPMALTSFAIGMTANFTHTPIANDNVISIFSTLGIISLFLFAGLEVDLNSLKSSIRQILSHIGFRLLVILILSLLATNFLNLSIVTAIVLALALSTPSTGFILDTIETSDTQSSLKYWIKLKAISAELVALGALLLFSQIESTRNIMISVIILILLLIGLPYIIQKLAGAIEKLAPGSEFGFIMMLAIISGLITKKLGAYYLVGAFIVGMSTRRYKTQSPNQNTDQILHTLKSFSTFFMPFYFFNSGIKMPLSAFSPQATVLAFIFLVTSGPLKVSTIILNRRRTQVEPWRDSFSIAISLMPNLVFGLVLAEILKEKMQLPIDIYGALIIYTLTITVLSTAILKFVPNRKSLGLDVIGAEPLDMNRSI